MLDSYCLCEFGNSPHKFLMLREKKKKSPKLGGVVKARSIHETDQVQVALKKEVPCLTEDGKICSSFPKEHSSNHKYQKPAFHKPAFECLLQGSYTAYLSHITGREVDGGAHSSKCAPRWYAWMEIHSSEDMFRTTHLLQF